MGLLNPIWLWGLLGLGVPVAIHLLSRKDMRVIRIGSLRHLKDGTTRQAIRIHLHNYLLLALRCLIVAAAALLLAGLYFNGDQKPARWILLEGNLTKDTQWRTIVDSLENGGYELRRLQTGFPLVAESEPDSIVPDYWNLAEELSRVQLDRCIVISRSRQSGFAGLRPAKDSRVTWLMGEYDSSQFTLALPRDPADSARVRIGNSTAYTTYFETRYLSTSEISPSPSDAQQNIMKPLSIVVSGNNVDPEEKRVVLAALQALDDQGWASLNIRQPAPTEIGQADWLIWLSPDAPPATGIKYAILKTDRETDNTSLWLHADVLTTKTPSARTTDSFERCWMIDSPITMQRAAREHLPLQLSNVLLADVNAKLNQTASLHDQRQMPESQMFASRAAESVVQAKVPARLASGHWVAVFLISLLITERWIANRQQL